MPQKLNMPLIALIASLGMLQPLALDPYLPNIQPISDAFAVSGELIQLTLSAYTLGIAGGVLVAGPLSDAIGRRTPVLIGLLGYLAASLLTAISPSIEWFFAGRSLQGFFASALGVVSAAMMRDLFEGLVLVRAVGRQMLVMATSWFIGPVLGSAILYVSDFRGLGLLLATFSLAIFILILKFLPDTMPTETRKKNTIGELFVRFGSVFKDRTFNGFVLVSVCISVALFSYLSVAPFVFDGFYGVPSNQVGIFFSFISFSAFVGTQVGARLSLKLQPQWALMIALGICATAGAGLIATATFGWGLFVFTGCIALYTFGFGISSTPVYALSMQPHPHEAGTAWAMMQVAGMLATTAAGPLYLSVDHTTSMGIGQIMLTCMVIATLVFFVIVQPSKLKAMS